MKTFLFSLFAVIFLNANVFGQNNSSLDLVVKKNEEIISLVTKGRTIEEMTKFSEVFKDADEKQKEILLREFLGNDFEYFSKLSNEMVGLYDIKNLETYRKENIEKYLNSISYILPEYEYINTTSISKPNVRAYRLCCYAVIGTAIATGAGCSGITAMLGTAICVAGAAMAEAAGIGLCAETYLH